MMNRKRHISNESSTCQQRSSKTKAPKHESGSLTARLLAVRKSDEADRAFWKNKQILPLSSASSLQDGLPTHLNVLVNEILRSEYHLLETNCLLSWRNVAAADDGAYQPPCAKIVFTKKDYENAGLQTGCRIKLYRPWVIIGGDVKECPVLFCPHYFRRST